MPVPAEGEPDVRAQVVRMFGFLEVAQRLQPASSGSDV
jgi:hypothetical protein